MSEKSAFLKISEGDCRVTPPYLTVLVDDVIVVVCPALLVNIQYTFVCAGLEMTLHPNTISFPTITGNLVDVRVTVGTAMEKKVIH